MVLFLDDSHCHDAMYPFTLTRNVADIRIGILTIREKWRMITGEIVICNPDEKPADCLVISANVIPTIDNFQDIIKTVKAGKTIDEKEDRPFLHYPWNIFQLNQWALKKDFLLLTTGKKSIPIEPNNQVINPSFVFIEEGAIIRYSVLNASEGPIYIGKNATIMEGCLVRGPFSLGEGATLKMGSKVYGATTIGPYCIGGGEIKNSILSGYSNKAHDGYLGDSVIGEWCNMGAGTSNSNVKNNAAPVRYPEICNPGGIEAGFKGGLLMGDYSRCAINTSFNTGSVVGICCNIFGIGMPPAHTASFSWGNDRYQLDKAIRDIINWKKLKNRELNPGEEERLTQLYKKLI